MIQAIGSVKVQKDAVMGKETAKGAFAKWSVKQSRKTGKKDESTGKDMYDTDYFNCECWIASDELGSRAKEMIIPKIKKDATQYITEGGELMINKWKADDGIEKQSIVIRFRSPYSIHIENIPITTATDAGEAADDDVPF
jgi:hypothetical protein